MFRAIKVFLISTSNVFQAMLGDFYENVRGQMDFAEEAYTRFDFPDIMFSFSLELGQQIS